MILYKCIGIYCCIMGTGILLYGDVPFTGFLAVLIGLIFFNIQPKRSEE